MHHHPCHLICRHSRHLYGIICHVTFIVLYVTTLVTFTCHYPRRFYVTTLVTSICRHSRHLYSIICHHSCHLLWYYLLPPSAGSQFGEWSWLPLGAPQAVQAQRCGGGAICLWRKEIPVCLCVCGWVGVCVCVCVRESVCASVRESVSVCQCVSVSVCLYLCLFVCLYVCVFTCLCMCVNASLYAYLFVCLFVCQFI